MVLVTQFNEPQNFFKLFCSILSVRQDHQEPVEWLDLVLLYGVKQGLNREVGLKVALFTKLGLYVCKKGLCSGMKKY